MPGGERAVGGVEGLREVLAGAERAVGVRLSTMGRGLEEDEAAFVAAAAAGRYAAAVAAGEVSSVGR